MTATHALGQGPSSAPPPSVDDPAEGRHQLAVMQALILGVSLVRERFRPALKEYLLHASERSLREGTRVIDAILADADNKDFVKQHMSTDPRVPQHKQPPPVCDRNRDCKSVEDVLRVLLAPGAGAHVNEGTWDSADYSIMGGPLRQIAFVRRHMLPGAVDDDGHRMSLVKSTLEVRNHVSHLKPITSAERRGMIKVLLSFLRACNATAADAGATLAAIERLKTHDDFMGEAEMLSRMQPWMTTLRDELNSMRDALTEGDSQLLTKPSSRTGRPTAVRLRSASGVSARQGAKRSRT
jgi:hypothetical protein